MAASAVNVTVSPSEIDLSKRATQAFTAVVQDTPNQAVTWSCTGGTIDASTGAYTAPSAFGTYTIKATSAEDGTAYGEATVTVKAQAGTDRLFTYDANGNMTSDGARTFEWDAENRLVSVTINATGHRSEFVYDGLGRRVQVIEKDPDATQTLQTTSDKKYLWVGTTIAEERSGDDGGTVTKRFFSQGFVDSDGTILLYTRDHLGSIRELVDMQQNVRARYEYDPYGNATKVSGDRDSVFLFTGHFWHSQSGLFLTLYRAYDPNLGRWLSRDPSAENGGPNLYAYVLNNPILLRDRLGLDFWDDFGNASAGFGDGIFLVLTLGYTDASALREALGIDGAVNKCSGAYRYGRGAGVLTAALAIAMFVGPPAIVGTGALLGGSVNLGLTAWANGGDITFDQGAAAFAGGALAGGLGALAGPMGGSLALGAGIGTSSGLGAVAGTALLSAGASASGQALANGIDPAHSGSIANAALWGGIGGGIGKMMPTANLNSLSQANYFAPTTASGMFASSNSAWYWGSSAASAAIGGGSNWGGPF